MKRIFIILFCCVLFLAGCSKNNISENTANNMSHEKALAYSIDIEVANKLSNIENIEDYDTETIKAMSVIVRTNLINNGYDLNKQEEYNQKDNHLYNIVKETSKEYLINNDGSNIESIYINDKKQNNEPWSKNIKKVEILKYMNKNNISLSNITNFEIEKNEDGSIKNIVVGGKTISAKKLVDYFDLPSNNITNIINENFSIIVEGVGIGNEYNFDITPTINNEFYGQNYQKILKNRYNNFTIITNN